VKNPLLNIPILHSRIYLPKKKRVRRFNGELPVRFGFPPPQIRIRRQPGLVQGLLKAMKEIFFPTEKTPSPPEIPVNLIISHHNQLNN
jgi:hypothetical protein